MALDNQEAKTNPKALTFNFLTIDAFQRWKKVFHKNEVFVYKNIVPQISSNKSTIKIFFLLHSISCLNIYTIRSQNRLCTYIPCNVSL